MSDVKISKNMLNKLTIRGNGSKWYNAKGKVTKEEVKKLVEEDIIPIYRKASTYGLSKIGEDCECTEINARQVVEYVPNKEYAKEEAHFNKNTKFPQNG